MNKDKAISDSIILSGDRVDNVEGKGSVHVESEGNTFILRISFMLYPYKNLLSISEITSQSPPLDGILSARDNCFVVKKKIKKGCASVIKEHGIYMFVVGNETKSHDLMTSSESSTNNSSSS